MDLNADGKLDILSGCYDYMSDLDPESESMAGIFHVFWGDEKHKFKASKVLEGTDDKPLIIDSGAETNESDEEDLSEAEMMAQFQVMASTFCTRPTAADLNGDGHLDIVVGNAAGTFFLFEGKGAGKFAPQSAQLTAGDSPLTVEDKSDPCVVDWDQDGDLDIISGSGRGGVHIAINEGDKSKAKFKPFEVLIEPSDWESQSSKFGDDHITGPSASTRVYVEDVNGDGMLDVLVGDSVTLMYPANGMEESEVRKKMDTLNKEMQELQEEMVPLQEKFFKEMEELSKSDEEDAKKAREELEERMDAAYEKMEPLYEQRAEFLREESTGYVWVYLQKSQGAPEAADSAKEGQSIADFKEYVAGKMEGLDDSKLDEIAAAVDKNSDGMISDEEFEARFEAIQKVMQ